MRPNTTLRAWRAGKQTVGAWLASPDAHATEVMANVGFDWLCVDMQHGLIDYSDAQNMLRAISTTATIPFVRVPWNEPSVIMKVLDAGAYGVVVPLINNAEEARRAVWAAKYP
ncbi:MAG: aldolase/citrate lyase family protein, partial [Dehalococcoidia bacterium]|nr:aldolase/citrate lyase family protein [Dehalococcoidia bacterium]